MGKQCKAKVIDRGRERQCTRKAKEHDIYCGQHGVRHLSESKKWNVTQAVDERLQDDSFLRRRLAAGWTMLNGEIGCSDDIEGRRDHNPKNYIDY